MQSARRSARDGGESAEDRQSGGERELLAGDRVQQALEDGREARRLEAPVAIGELAEQAVSGGASVEAGQVDVEPEKPP